MPVWHANIGVDLPDIPVVLSERFTPRPPQQDPIQEAEATFQTNPIQVPAVNMSEGRPKSYSTQDRDADRKYEAEERRIEHEANLAGTKNKKKRLQATQAYEKEERRIAYQDQKADIKRQWETSTAPQCRPTEARAVI
jgi:hypothetical protein